MAELEADAPRISCRDETRGYLLKGVLRTLVALDQSDGPDAGIEALDTWLGGAARGRITTFAELGRTIRRHRPQIEAAIGEDLSHALVESTSTKIPVLTRVAFGFHSTEALAVAMLSLGGYPPDLPAGQSDPRVRQESLKSLGTAGEKA